MSNTPTSETPAAKTTPPAKAAGVPPKKPAKKVAKSWPSVNALLTTASITATLGGWAFFTVQEQTPSVVEAATVESPPALVESAPPTTPIYTLTIDLPPIPTVVPRPNFNVASAAPAASSTTDTPIQAPQAPEAPAAAPEIRSVTAPPPVVSAPPVAAPAPVAPAPAATTRSSR